MAKSFTLTCAKSCLEQQLADFDVMGTNPVWVKNKTKQLLEEWLVGVDRKIDELPPVKADGESVRMLISFGGAAELVLKTLCTQFNLSESEAARRIIGLLASNHDTTVERTAPVEANLFVDIMNSAGYKEARPEQISFYLQNKASLTNKKIGLSEAATGTGKTVSMLISAAEIANSTQSRVVIAVPTISLMYQFKDAYDKPANQDMPSLSESIQQHLGSAPSLRSIFGRREFVCEEMLFSLIRSGDLTLEQSTAAQKWLDHTVITNSNDPDVWLIPSLAKVVNEFGDFPFDEVRLPEYVMEHDRGFKAYRRQMQRKSIHDAEIIIATHAMVGIDFRSRLYSSRKDEEYQEITETLGDNFNEFLSASKRDRELKDSKDDDADKLARSQQQVADATSNLRHYEAERARRLVVITEENGTIPAYRYLMVDECHLFESSLSRVLSNYVAIRQIGRELREFMEAGGKVSKTSIKQVNLALKDITACGPSSDAESRSGDVVILNGANSERHPELIPAIRTIVNVIEGIKAPAKGSEPIASGLYLALKRDLMALRAVANGSYGMLNFSPTRKFPQMIVGRPSIESMLRQLWAFVEGASCVSATIYLPKGNTTTAWYLKSVLAIPDHREVEYSPSIGPWIYRPVKEIWQPSDERDIENLTPTSYVAYKMSEAQFIKDTELWHQSISKSIVERVLSSAAGGILVLCTSYKTCNDVAGYLSESSKDVVIVEAKPSLSLSQQKMMFIAARKEGKQSIWLATGGAWTGLDVSGKDIGIDAEEDKLLTDLVIPRLPFYTNRSITHQHRKIYRPSTNWEVFETCFAFRQALGRLIRRVGLPKNRKIWMLDARMVGKDAARYTIFQKILDGYKNY